MKIKCFWEHNGEDTILYSVDYPGAYTRGANLEIAMSKMPSEIRSFLMWSGNPCIDESSVEITEEKQSELNIRDADSDAIFSAEMLPLTDKEYTCLKNLTLKSASDFLELYNSIPDKRISCLAERKTFYGMRPRTAEEMYEHTKNVNGYYFGEIGVDCGSDGDIVTCRKLGFDMLEMQSDFLRNKAVVGSYSEMWSLKKVLRRFIWHDRIHAKAMYRMAVNTFSDSDIPNVFCF